MKPNEFCDEDNNQHSTERIFVSKQEPYEKESYYDFEDFKNLIKQNHNSEKKYRGIINYLIAKVQLKSDTDPIIDILKKTGKDFSYLNDINPKGIEYSLSIFYNMLNNRYETFYNSDEDNLIDLSNDLEIIHNSLIEVYNKPAVDIIFDIK